MLSVTDWLCLVLLGGAYLLDGAMRITQTMFDQGKSANNGWNKKQIKCLGENWPQETGWRARIFDRDHTQESIDKFISLRTPDKPPKPDPAADRSWLSSEQRAGEDEMWKILGSIGVPTFSLARPKAIGRLMNHLGITGSPPAKPKALDWLAAWFTGAAQTKVEEAENRAEDKTSRPRKKDKRERNAAESFPVDIPWSNYAEYLASDLWFAIRRVVLIEAEYKCCACSSRATQVHHTSYDRKTMRGRDLSKLVAICAECHRWIEFDDQGNKVSLATANQRLELLHVHARDFEASGLDGEFLKIVG